MEGDVCPLQVDCCEGFFVRGCGEEGPEYGGYDEGKGGDCAVE